MRLEVIDLSEWSEVLPEQGFGPFHTAEALEVIDEHTTADMQLFAGFNGQQPVALLPMFVRDEPVGRLASSPPPGFELRGLGPILMPTSPKRGKREKLNDEFTRLIIDAIDGEASTTLLLMTCETEYGDPRPYGWAGFDVQTKYTYQIDLESTTQEELLHSFSKSLRRDIRDAADEIRVEVRGRSDARDLYEATKARYEEQGKGFEVPWRFLSDMLVALDDRAAVYVAESPGGEFLSGIVVVYSNDTAYFWMGGIRQTEVEHNVNGLLHWRAIKDLFEDPSRESIDTYDLYSANKRDIVRFKRKFGGQLKPYYRIESKSLPLTVAKRAYRLKRDLLL